MPKGRQGCFTCGERSQVVLQVWLRDYTDEKYANGCRKQKTVGSITRSFCLPCSKDPWVEAASALHRHRDPARCGCGICGQATDSRIQVWLRTTDGATVMSATGSFCEECSLSVFDAATRLLDPDTWRYDEVQRRIPTAGLEAARAASFAA